MPATLTPVSLRLTPEEYFAWEETQVERHEYINGEIFPISGASRTHKVIADNLHFFLRIALAKTECRGFTEGLRVQVEAGGRYTYPDVTVVCGEEKYLDTKRQTLTNPTLVVEVLSESTKAYDRSEKLASYRELFSIQEIVLIHQDRRAAEVYRREGAGRWSIEEVPADGALELASVGATVSMDDVYVETGVPGV